MRVNPDIYAIFADGPSVKLTSNVAIKTLSRHRHATKKFPLKEIEFKAHLFAGLVGQSAFVFRLEQPLHFHR